MHYKAIMSEVVPRVPEFFFGFLTRETTTAQEEFKEFSLFVFDFDAWNEFLQKNVSNVSIEKFSWIFESSLD